MEPSVVVSVKQLLDAVADQVERLRGRVPHVDAGDEDLAVIGRQGMLGWILQEIIENSYAYGGRRVEVWVAVRPVFATATIEIAIDDNGKGLSPEKRAELYDIDRFSGSRLLDGHQASASFRPRCTLRPCTE